MTTELSTVVKDDGDEALDTRGDAFVAAGVLTAGRPSFFALLSFGVFGRPGS